MAEIVNGSINARAFNEKGNRSYHYIAQENPKDGLGGTLHRRHAKPSPLSSEKHLPKKS